MPLVNKEKRYKIKRMKIIHRYVLREIISPFIFGFFFFSLILLVSILFQLTELVFLQKAPLIQVGKLLLFILPSFLDIVLPIALLFAVLLSFGRLSADGEIIALRSAGINLFFLEKPLLVFTAGLTIVSLYFSAQLTPWCNQNYQKTYEEILLQKPTIQVKERAIIDIGERKFYAYKIDEKTQKIQDIAIYEFLPQENHLFPQITLAQEGEISNNVLNLKKVNIYRFGQNYQLIQQGKFTRQKIYLVDQITSGRQKEKKSAEMTLWEIRAKMKDQALLPEEAREFALDFHTRVVIPLAAFFLGIVAVPLGIKIERGDKSISLGITLVLVIIYYILLLTGVFLGRSGFLLPILAMWIPNFFIISLAIWLNLRLIKQ